MINGGLFYEKEVGVILQKDGIPPFWKPFLTFSEVMQIRGDCVRVIYWNYGILLIFSTGIPVFSSYFNLSMGGKL